MIVGAGLPGCRGFLSQAEALPVGPASPSHAGGPSGLSEPRSLASLVESQSPATAAVRVGLQWMPH
jgi:hypothetical protein